MKILYVASEAAPYSASGGLGDVMGALPKAITEIDENIETEVILPLYRSMSESYRRKLVKVMDISFKLSWRSTGASVFKLENGGVTYYFIENHYYFDRPNLYGEWDDGERFAFFSMAVIEFITACDRKPDILHANDWQTALSVIYLKTKYCDNSELSAIKTLYTIHNIEYQGKFDKAILGDVFALDQKFLAHVEFDGCINLMKGAIVLSDYVSTVSPRYAEELQDDFFAFGLASIIKSVNHKLSGVVNGIDYSYFSPELGGDIYAPFTKRGVKGGKAKNKKMLQADLGFEIRADVPLIVMITRLTSQKGIDLLIHIIDELLENDVQLAVLGTGEKEYEQALSSISERYMNFKAVLKFDRGLSKKMYAGADMFIMPSKSEPCGLAQMISCSYGTVPIVRSVGGLYDTIIPYADENSNGFTFENYNAHELLFTVKDALEVYKNREAWLALVKRAIKTDFSWRNSATKYIMIYNNLLTW